jgi:hypothetical protein
MASPRMTTSASSPSYLPGTRCPFANPAMVDHTKRELATLPIFEA